MNISIVQVKADPNTATIEDKIASQLAEQVLQNAPVCDTYITYQNLKGVHSKASIRRILEREAKAQLAAKEGPKISIIKDHEKISATDPSNLPYLHRSDAI